MILIQTILIDGDSCANHAVVGRLEVKNTLVASAPVKTNVPSFNAITWFQSPGWGNRTFPAFNEVQLRDPFNLDSVNALLLPTSPAVGAASFAANRLSDPFFDPVTYVGAFDTTATSDWTDGWAAFMYMVSTSGSVSTTAKDTPIASISLTPTIAADFTNLHLDLDESVVLAVRIYSTAGEYYSTPVSQRAAVGKHTFGLNLSDLPAGMYFVQIQAGIAMKTERLVVVR